MLSAQHADVNITTFLHSFHGMSLDSVGMTGDVLCKARNDASICPVHCHFLHSKDEIKRQFSRLKLWLIGKGLTLHQLLS